MNKRNRELRSPRHYIYLVRHGQYLPSEEGGVLTALGKKQAQRVARYLRQFSVASIRSSTSSRAVETAEIIARFIGLTYGGGDPSWNEVIPTAAPGIHVSLEKRREGRQATEKLFQERLLCSARTRHDVIVCHGNLIRALSCRVLNAPTKAWLKMETFHCSTTILVVEPKNGITIASYGEKAYLSPKMLSIA